MNKLIEDSLKEFNLEEEDEEREIEEISTRFAESVFGPHYLHDCLVYDNQGEFKIKGTPCSILYSSLHKCFFLRGREDTLFFCPIRSLSSLGQVVKNHYQECL